MIVHYYGIVWNEARMLPYFFRHYDQFVDRYVMYDDGSDDGTVEALRAHGAEVRPLPHTRETLCESCADLRSHCWKESRGAADLVLVCDVDEFLWHPDLPTFLEACRDSTVFRSRGWQMVHDRFPGTNGQIYDEVCRGAADPDFDKTCLFSPDIDEINYGVGCHVASPSGLVRDTSYGRLSLLHCKYLGVRYTTARYAQLARKIPATDLAKGWGSHYLMKEDSVATAIQALFSRSVTIPGL